MSVFVEIITLYLFMDVSIVVLVAVVATAVLIRQQCVTEIISFT